MTVIPYIHASCVEKDGRGILLKGHSGAGKSSFALALINRGFTLVADDQVLASAKDDRLLAEPADALKGLLEVRGVGLLRMRYSPSCQIQVLIDLVPGFRSERLPSPKTQLLHGLPIRSFQINPMDPRSIEKVLVLFHPDFQGFYESESGNQILESRIQNLESRSESRSESRFRILDSGF